MAAPLHAGAVDPEGGIAGPVRLTEAAEPGITEASAYDMRGPDVPCAGGTRQDKGLVAQ